MINILLIIIHIIFFICILKVCYQNNIDTFFSLMLLNLFDDLYHYIYYI
jgi:hypothetical protein